MSDPGSLSTKRPNSIPLVAIGTALLWFGWYGFNAGSELQMNGITALAFLNTDIAASVAAVTWLILDWTISPGRPTFIGLLTGSVAGLATITPAAGYVSMPTAFFIGIIAAVSCYLAVKLKNHFKWDDALDVWGIHGVGGFLGTILLGIFGYPEYQSQWGKWSPSWRIKIFYDTDLRLHIICGLCIRFHLPDAGCN